MGLKPRLGRFQGLSKKSTVSLQALQALKPKSAFSFFGFVDNYESNLEKKSRAGRSGSGYVVSEGFGSGRVGLGMSFSSQIKGAFALNRFSGEPRYGSVSLTPRTEGSARVKSSWDGASAALAYNPDDQGFTVRASSLYVWGKTKNERYMRSRYGRFRAKGHAESFISGSLVQAGYNIKFCQAHALTFYAEGLIATAFWKDYDEKANFPPCKISRNKERALERSIGVRYQTPVGRSQELQAWAAHVVGSRETSGMSSRPLITEDVFYQLSSPSHKRRYSGVEVGFEHRLISTEDIVVGLAGTTRFHRLKRIDAQSCSCSIQYLF